MSNAEILAKLPPEQLLHAYDENEALMRRRARGDYNSYGELVAARETAEEFRNEILRRLKDQYEART